jgi:hypothetical protein
VVKAIQKRTKISLNSSFPKRGIISFRVTPLPLPAGRQGEIPPLKIRGERGSYDFLGRSREILS